MPSLETSTVEKGLTNTTEDLRAAKLGFVFCSELLNDDEQIHCLRNHIPPPQAQAAYIITVSY